MNVEKKMLGQILFGSSAKIRCLNISVGMLFPATPAGRSVKHTAMSSPKASLSLKILDYLTEKRLNAAKIEEAKMVYFELDGNGYSVTNTSDGLLISSAGANLSNNHIAIGEVLYDLAFGSDAEIITSFDDCVNSIASSANIRPDAASLFCDSMYYGVSKFRREVLVTVDNSLAEQMVRASSNGLLSPIESLKPLTSLPTLAVETAKPKRKTERKKVSTVIKDCKDGAYKVPYDWKDVEHIQPVSALDGFVPNEAFESVLKKIKVRTEKVLTRLDINPEDRVAALGKDYINISLVGKPGTGKTVMAYAISAATGMPVYSVNLSHNTDEDEFQGQTKIVDGKAQFVETDFLNAYTNGGIIILEEVNLANPAVIMGALGQAVEFPFILKRNGYETVRRHPLCVIITTMNIGTAGSKIPSQAFMNRFKQTYTLNDPTASDFVKILCTSGAEKAKCQWVYDAYEKIVAYLNSDEINEEDIAMTLSLRTCFGALENMEEGDSPLDAIKHSIIGKIAESDLALARDCETEVLKKSVPKPMF